MKNTALLLLALLLVSPGLAATTFAAESIASAVTVNHLRCEYRPNPLGIDAARPWLSWVLDSGRQTAYQVVVNGLWDSGKVNSDQSVNVEYVGKPSAWSAPAIWTMGILRPEDWTAQWISTEVTPPVSAAGEKLKLIKATYVALDGTASVDVTEHVAKLVKDGRLNLRVDPKLLHTTSASGTT